MWLIRKIVFSCLGLFFFGFVHANSVSTETEASLCSPEKIEQIKQIFKTNEDCSELNYKQKIGLSLIEVQKIFHPEVSLLKNDFVLHPQDLSSRTVEVYRSYAACANLFCQNTVKLCGGNAIDKNLDRFQYCQTRLGFHKNVFKQVLTEVHLHNNSQKAQVLKRERFRLFEKKMREWFVPTMIKLVNNWDNFVAKVTTLVRNPVGS